MVVEKIIGILSFKPSKFFKRYIFFVSQKRKVAKNFYEKDFYELLNNSFYGNTTENVRNLVRLEFIKNMNKRKL